jgi:hypothetical protein
MDCIECAHASQALPFITCDIGQLTATLTLCLEGTLHESAIRTGIIS